MSSVVIGTTSVSAVLIVTALVFAVLALIPASIASGKGRSGPGFWIFGLLFFLPALVVALLLTNPMVRSGDIVRTTNLITLDDRTRIPKGWISKVLDTDVIEGVPTVRITGPAGTKHWIAKGDVRGT